MSKKTYGRDALIKKYGIRIVKKACDSFKDKHCCIDEFEKKCKQLKNKQNDSK